jgi:hypothetical protein
MVDRFTYGWEGKRHKGTRIGTLWMKGDLDLDGDVTIIKDFDDFHRIEKLDLLQDWIGLLQREYDKLIKEKENDQ